MTPTPDIDSDSDIHNVIRMPWGTGPNAPFLYSHLLTVMARVVQGPSAVSSALSESFSVMSRPVGLAPVLRLNMTVWSSLEDQDYNVSVEETKLQCHGQIGPIRAQD